EDYGHDFACKDIAHYVKMMQKYLHKRAPALKCSAGDILFSTRDAIVELQQELEQKLWPGRPGQSAKLTAPPAGDAQDPFPVFSEENLGSEWERDIDLDNNDDSNPVESASKLATTAPSSRRRSRAARHEC